MLLPWGIFKKEQAPKKVPLRLAHTFLYIALIKITYSLGDFPPTSSSHGAPLYAPRFLRKEACLRFCCFSFNSHNIRLNAIDGISRHPSCHKHTIFRISVSLLSLSLSRKARSSRCSTVIASVIMTW